MGIFQQFPYTNFHEMNLDQILKMMTEIRAEWELVKDEWENFSEYLAEYFNNLNESLPYVMPELFGAKGDGVTDDTAAIQEAFDSGYSVIFDGHKTYYIADAVNVNEGNDIDFNNCKIKCGGSVGINVVGSGGQAHDMQPVYIHDLNIEGNGYNTLIYWDNVLKSTLENIRFYNFGVGFHFASGYETYGNNLRFIGTNKYATAMISNGGDSYFYNIVMRDCATGIHMTAGSNKWMNVHGWIYDRSLYKDSVMVLDECVGGIHNEWIYPYFDTYERCYMKTGLSTVTMLYPVLYNNYDITDPIYDKNTAYFLHVTYSPGDEIYANRIYVNQLITQLGIDSQIYEICNDTSLEFHLSHIVASPATIANINATSAFNDISNIYSQIDIYDITDDFITPASGFTVKYSGHVYKQYRHIFGTLVLEKSTNFVAGSTETVGTLNHHAMQSQQSLAGFSTSEWGTTDIGYMYMSTDTLTVKTEQSGMSYVKIIIDYVMPEY